jgi:hypothetical protein
MGMHYPTPQEIGIRIPADLLPDRFCAGFQHALSGGQIDRAEHLRRSFRAGYRAAKLYLRAYRRQRGILEFPARWRFRSKAHIT